MHALPLSYFLTTEYYTNRTLEQMMGLDHVLKVDDSPLTSPKTPCASWDSIPDLEKVPYVTNAFRTTCLNVNINAIVIHDSFFNRVDLMLAENFHKAALVQTAFIPILIKHEINEVKPNVLIEEIVQRKLNADLIPPPLTSIGTIVGVEAFKSMAHKLLPDDFLKNLFNYQLHSASA